MAQIEKNHDDKTVSLGGFYLTTPTVINRSNWGSVHAKMCAELQIPNLESKYPGDLYKDMKQACFEVWVAPNELQIATHCTDPNTGELSAGLVKNYWENIDSIEHSLGHGDVRLADLTIALGVSTRDLKKQFPKAIWKQLQQQTPEDNRALVTFLKEANIGDVVLQGKIVGAMLSGAPEVVDAFVTGRLNYPNGGDLSAYGWLDILWALENKEAFAMQGYADEQSPGVEAITMVNDHMFIAREVGEGKSVSNKSANAFFRQHVRYAEMAHKLSSSVSELPFASQVMLDKEIKLAFGTARLLDSPKAYVLEGATMGHCIWGTGYRNSAAIGASISYHLQDMKGNHSTANFRAEDYVPVELSQNKAKNNAKPSTECQAIANAIVHHYKAKNHAAEMEQSSIEKDVFSMDREYQSVEDRMKGFLARSDGGEHQTEEIASNANTMLTNNIRNLTQR